MGSRILGLLLCAALGTGCVAAAPTTVDLYLPSGRLTLEVEELLARAGLEEGEEVKVRELGRDSRTSHHLVTLRGAESLHRHDEHELWVMILQGHGDMRLGEDERRLGEGSVIYVPRATVHAFRNEARAPAVAYVVYSPPFDGADRVPVAE